jgi:hypothetical protein
MKFEELTELEQKVLKLRLEGKKHREIAAEFGFSATRAYELTTRARRRLRGPNLSIRLLHCLRRLTPERTQLMTDDELLAISGIGPEALEELRSRYPYLGGLPCPHCGGTGRTSDRCECIVCPLNRTIFSPRSKVRLSRSSVPNPREKGVAS